MLYFYGRFLRMRIVAAKPIMIAIIMPATAGTKYASVTDCGVGVGVVCVGGASSTAKAVSACDGQ